MKIGFLSFDFSLDFPGEDGHPTPGGAGWYRCALPARYLRENGIEAMHCPGVASFGSEIMLKDWEEKLHGDFDIIVIQRWMHRDAALIIEQARDAGQVIVNDVDDWYGGVHSSNRVFIESHPRRDLKMNRAEQRRRKITTPEPLAHFNYYQDAIKASSAIITSTPHLAERMRSAGPLVHVVRNAIDYDRWLARPPNLSSEHPVVGWVGGVSTHPGDLESMRGILGPVSERRDLPVYHGGYFDKYPTFAEIARVNPERFSQDDMKDVFHYPEFFERFDVGIVPLVESSFSDSKSCIKGMEMASAGIPFVASTAAEYQWLHDEHGIGRLAKRPTHWIRHLEELCDPRVRKEESERQREAMKAFSFSHKWVDWLQAYLKIMSEAC